MERLTQIKKQTKIWLIFGWASPFLFLLAATAYYGISHSSIPLIMYLSWLFFIGISLFWWFWVVKVIHEMTHMFKVIFDMVKDVRTDINNIHDEIKKP